MNKSIRRKTKEKLRKTKEKLRNKLNRLKTHKNKRTYIKRKASGVNFTTTRDELSSSRDGFKSPNDGFKKHDYRWKQMKRHIENFRVESCDGISGTESLKEKLNIMKESIMKESNDKQMVPVPYDHYLFAYCNELVQGPESLDRVNRPTTSIEATDAIQDVFENNFLLANDNVKKTNTEYNSPLLDPEKFMEDISIFYKKHKKNLVIVSHSQFMSALCRFILKNTTKDKIVFDNLDILHLIISKRNNRVQNMIIRRYANLYDNLREEPLIDSQEYYHVFIMRHCLGCHNITPGILTKTTQIIKQKQSGDQLGYLDWSICLNYITYEMKNVKNSLKTILEKYGVNRNNRESNIGNSYIFGSSVIFRAMLTCTVLYNILHIKDKSIKTNKITETYDKPPSYKSTMLSR